MADHEATDAHDRSQHAFWARLMNDLEASSRSAGGARLDDEAIGTSWKPPTVSSPIPAELLERARAILASHFEAVTFLEARRNSTLAHLAAVRTVADAGGSDRAVYLDVAG